MSDISEYYMAILRNIGPHAPVDLDSIISTPPAPSTEIVPQTNRAAPPSKMLWTRPEVDTSYIGIRITSPVARPEQVVMSLSAIAVERQVVPIFISWIGNCGLQNYGLRVEQVSGADEAAKHAAEDQLKRLWNLAIVIDAKDVSAF